MAFVLPLRAVLCRCQPAFAQVRYRIGQYLALCWKSPRYAPPADVAVGTRPLSRPAMQMALAAPPGTTQCDAAHRISRFENP